jgi:hypothetical protein
VSKHHVLKAELSIIYLILHALKPQGTVDVTAMRASMCKSTSEHSEALTSLEIVARLFK